MLENCKSAQERWGGVSEIVDRWLGERQKLLVQYCALSECFSDTDDLSPGSNVQHFCQSLVDYVSAGHFEIYDQLVREAEELDDKEGLKQAGDLYKIIDVTTEVILDFNDKYQETDDLETIERDLSSVGEKLVTRFETEDKMIEVLHYAHQDQVSS
ncbi:MAG: regulator of sigma D [Flavobacteriales bacterium]|jgi:regulator of sigma D